MPALLKPGFENRVGSIWIGDRRFAPRAGKGVEGPCSEEFRSKDGVQILNFHGLHDSNIFWRKGNWRGGCGTSHQMH